MADILGMLEGEQLVSISEGYDYISATSNFVGLKLFPIVRTDNMKLAVAQLVEGGKIPVMALVHALDTEAHIGDRPNFEEVKYELFLIKEKLNQGEEIKKRIRNLGMSQAERAIVESIYNDAANLISRVLTRMEVMACEVLSTGRLTIKENGVDTTVTYGVPDSHYITVKNWSNASADILGDLAKIKTRSKDRIVRALVSNKTMGYILGNTKLTSIASGQNPPAFATKDWAVNYIKALFNIDFAVVGGTYKTSAQSTTEYNFFKDDVITFLETLGEVGNTFVTSTPEEDYGIAESTSGAVAITQEVTKDPAGVWTKASAVAFPCPADATALWVCSVS